MLKLVYLLILFMDICLTQIVVTTPMTLIKASKLLVISGSEQHLAMKYILQSHPQLSNHTILNITKSQIPANLTAVNYTIILESGTEKILITLIMDMNLPQFNINFSVIALFPASNQQIYNSSDLTSPASLSVGPENTNNTNSSQAILADLTSNPNGINLTDINQNTNARNRYSHQPLNGYNILTNFNQSIFGLVWAYTLGEYPNLVNYQIDKVHYQNVAGIKFFIECIDFMRFSKVNTLVYLNLTKKIKVLEFNISCVTTKDGCEDDTARKIYYGNELILKTHPELFRYRLISIDIQSNQNSSLNFMSTFQNKKIKLRVIASIESRNNENLISSYYSYSQF